MRGSSPGLYATARHERHPVPPLSVPLSSLLHIGVVRTAAAFGRHPHEVLGGVFDIAGLAVHAILRIDLQLVLARRIFDELIDRCGAISGLRACIFPEIDLDRHSGVF